MPERSKIITEVDIKFCEKAQKQITLNMIDLVKHYIGYHSKYNTGFGWLLNALKLYEGHVISLKGYNKIFSWFNTDYNLNQVVPVEEWEEYSRLGIYINSYFSTLNKGLQKIG